MTQKINNYKLLITFIGKFLSILGLAYVVFKLSSEYSFSEFLEQFSTIKRILILLFIINIITYILGVGVWHGILNKYSSIDLPYKKSLYYYTKTDIAKYLPGNIFHIVGRQIFAMKLHLKQKEMLKVTVLYNFVILASSIFIIAFVSFYLILIPFYMLSIFILIAAVVLFIFLVIYPRFSYLEKSKMIAILCMNLILQSLILLLIISSQVIGINLEYSIIIIGVYTLSWIVGFVTPGASGGLGVREASFISIISYVNLDISDQVIIFSILLIRLINVFTDILLFLITYLYKDNDLITSNQM